MQYETKLVNNRKHTTSKKMRASYKISTFALVITSSRENSKQKLFLKRYIPSIFVPSISTYLKSITNSKLVVSNGRHNVVFIAYFVARLPLNFYFQWLRKTQIINKPGFSLFPDNFLTSILT